MPTSIDKQLADLEKRKESIIAREKQLLAKKKEKERRARTKRLIEIGAAVESVLGRPIEKNDLPNLIDFLKKQEDRGRWFSKAMESKKKE